MLAVVVVAAGLSVSCTRGGPPELAGFVARTYRSGGSTAAYRLFIPVGYDAGRRYPLVLWLHGGGGRGTDNQKQLLSDQRHAIEFFTSATTQAKYAHFVVAPQTEWSWLGDAGMRAIEIVDSLKSDFSVDENRVYVAGQSIGAAGAWYLPTQAPEKFAAAILLAGSGDVSAAPAWTAIPVWVFHGDRDVVSPVNWAREMVRAVKAAGGSVTYTEISGAGHEIWQRAFTEPGLADWLFAQSR